MDYKKEIIEMLECAALLCPERLGECSQRFHGNASQFHMVLPPIESNIFYFTQLRGTI